MPKNGFFFLFMAPVTPKAKNVKDPGRSLKRTTTESLSSAAGSNCRLRHPCPGSRTPRTTQPRLPWIPRAEVHETRLPAASAKGRRRRARARGRRFLAPRANRVSLS